MDTNNQTLADIFNEEISDNQTNKTDVAETVDESSKETEETEAEQADETKDDEENAEEDSAEGDTSKESGTEEETKDTNEDVSVFEEVNKLSGIEIEGEFEENAEGVLKYVEIANKKAIDAFEEQLKADFPDAYEYMYHLSQGGTRKSYFEITGSRDYSSTVIKTDDIAIQKEIIADALRAKDNSEKMIKKLLEVYEDEGELEEEAKHNLKWLQEEQSKKQAVVNEKLESERKANLAVMSDMANIIKTAVDEGNLNGFVVPKAERAPFFNQVAQNVRYLGDNKFAIVREVNAKELEKELQAEFFRYKGGDLKKLVVAQAKTITTKRFQKTVQEGQKRIKGSEHNAKITGVNDLF